MSAAIFQEDVLFYQRLLKASGFYTDVLDGDWGPNTSAADQQFEAASVALANQYGAFDLRSERNISTLHIKAQESARQFLQALSGFGVVARIISGTRTYKEQDALYQKGRFGSPGPIVTNAEGGESNHNFGIAWDVGLFRDGEYLDGDTAEEIGWYEAAAAAVSAVPLEWGGNWTSFRDVPHYQLKTGLSTSAVRQRFEAGQPYV